MKKYSIKKYVAWTLLASMVICSGCGGRSGVNSETQSVKDVNYDIQKESEKESEKERETRTITDVTIETVKQSNVHVFDERGQERFDITPKDGKVITATPMSYDAALAATDRTKKYFYYADGDTNVALKYENGEPKELNINGKSIKTSLKQESGGPNIWLRDLNKDGKRDIIIEWDGYRYYDIMVVVSDGDTYKEIELPKKLPEISAVALDDYKMQVVSKECNVNQEYVMENRFAHSMLNSYMVYYDNGKLANTSYNIPISFTTTVETDCYEVGSDTVIAVKNMVQSGSDFTGITLVYYYRFTADGTMKTDVKMINENYYPF